MRKHTNISLSREIYLKLKDRGKFGESFSDLVSRILDQLDLKEEVGIRDDKR